MAFGKSEVVALRCLHQRGELNLASYNNCFLWGSGNGLWLANRYRPRKGRLKTYYKLTWGRLKLFTLSRYAARKKNVLGAWEASLNGGKSCVVRERAPRKGRHRPPHEGHLRPLRKGKEVLMLRIVQSVNGLSPSTGLATVPTVTFMPCSPTGIG